MKHWINKNYKTLIITAFLVPIITVAVVSISHVTKWYGISNPVSWSVYLSIGIEIAALSALAAISADMGKKVYFPFAIVTIVQFIGNIFFAYSYIDVNSQPFRDWVDLVAPLLEFMGVEPTDFIGHKRFLALFAGGMLPIISLSFLHMLVKFTEEDRLKEIKNESIDKQIQDNLIKADLADESARIKLTERDLQILEQYLSNPPQPNDALKKAAEEHRLTMEKATIADDEQQVKQKQKETLIEIMKMDQELGLYDEPIVNPIKKEEVEITPALSDEEVREMFMDEWERKFDLVEEEQDDMDIEEIMENPPVDLSKESERQFYVMDDMEVKEVLPTEEEENLNFNQSFDQDSNVIDSGDFINETLEPSPEPVQKYIIDEYVEPKEDLIEYIEKNEQSFWRDHIEENDDDLKKKQ